MKNQHKESSRDFALRPVGLSTHPAGRLRTAARVAVERRRRIG